MILLQLLPHDVQKDRKNVATRFPFQSGLPPPRLDAWPYDGYRRSKLEIGSGQVMRVVPLYEDAAPKFLKGGFFEAKQQ